MPLLAAPLADKSAARPLVLFDGVCLLCSTFVQFVLDHNADETITFAALQSAVGEAVLQKAGLPLDVSTVVYIDEAGVHTRSTAALRVLQRCRLAYAPLAHAPHLGPARAPRRRGGKMCRRRPLPRLRQGRRRRRAAG